MLFSICSVSVSLALKASLLQDWPQADMIPHRHTAAPLGVVSTKEVTDPELLAEAATLVPVLRGGGALADGRDEFPRVRGWTQFRNHTVSWNAEELWHVEFDGRVPAGVGRAAMITIDTISNAGARIENTRFVNTTCNLGRIKSSNAVIKGCSFENARIPNLEITCKTRRRDAFSICVSLTWEAPMRRPTAVL